MNSAVAQFQDLLDQGAALDHFARMIAAMGGPMDLQRIGTDTCPKPRSF